MNALKNKKGLELRGAERAFQYDRDTIIVYTGLHPDDVRPFIRIGAGDSTPDGLIRHIENVVLPDQDPVNVGLELFWLHNTLENGGDLIRYVGSKDQVSRIYSFSGMRELEESGKEETHVETLAYRLMPPARRNAKDRCLINFFETGNVNVSVDGTRVLDLQTRKKAFLSLDKEYELIARALRRRVPFCADGFSFVALPGARTGAVSAFWNFNGAGLLLNPPRDFHYRLFELGIEPDRTSMCIASSAYAPGFTEAIRRRNALGSSIGVFTLNTDKLGDLKRIYGRANMRVFEDSRSLPDARSTSFFVSRSGSHGLFTVPGSGGSERQIQILFPISSTVKQNRSFDFLRGPHDLELVRLSSPDEWKAGWQSRLALVESGSVSAGAFARMTLREGVRPLLAGKEYRIVHHEAAVGLAEPILESLAGSEPEEAIRELVLMALGLDFSPERTETILRELASAKPPADMALRQNVAQALALVLELPQYQVAYDERMQRLLAKASARWTPDGQRVSAWLALGEQAVALDILVLGSRRTYHVVRGIDAAPVQLALPPGLEELEANPKEYRRRLNKWSKVAARLPEGGPFEDGIEFLEKVYEERLRLLEERARLKSLVGDLGMQWKPVQLPVVPAWVPERWQPLYLSALGLWARFRSWVVGMYGRLTDRG